MDHELLEQLQLIVERLGDIQGRMATKEELRELETRIMVTLENDVSRRISSLFDGYQMAMEKQYELGMASAYDLESLQYQRSTVESQLASLEFQITTSKITLESMCGMELNGTVRLGALTMPTADQLASVSYEENLQKALAGEMSVTELSGLEKSYYNTCRSYLNGNLTTANGWAAYASRIQAVEVLENTGTRKKPAISLGSAEGEIPQNLQDLETEAFLKIIAGEEPVDYFDTFAQEWYANGGEELTEKVRN